MDRLNLFARYFLRLADGTVRIVEQSLLEQLGIISWIQHHFSFAVQSIQFLFHQLFFLFLLLLQLPSPHHQTNHADHHQDESSPHSPSYQDKLVLPPLVNPRCLTNNTRPSCLGLQLTCLKRLVPIEVVLTLAMRWLAVGLQCVRNIRAWYTSAHIEGPEITLFTVTNIFPWSLPRNGMAYPITHKYTLIIGICLK